MRLLLLLVAASLVVGASASSGNADPASWPSPGDIKTLPVGYQDRIETGLRGFSLLPSARQRVLLLDFIRDSHRWILAHPGIDPGGWDITKLDYIAIVKDEPTRMYPEAIVCDYLVRSANGRGVFVSHGYPKPQFSERFIGPTIDPAQFAMATRLVKEGYYDLGPDYWKRSRGVTGPLPAGVALLSQMPSPVDLIDSVEVKGETRSAALAELMDRLTAEFLALPSRVQRHALKFFFKESFAWSPLYPEPRSLPWDAGKIDLLNFRRTGMHLLPGFAVDLPFLVRAPDGQLGLDYAERLDPFVCADNLPRTQSAQVVGRMEALMLRDLLSARSDPMTSNKRGSSMAPTFTPAIHVKKGRKLRQLKIEKCTSVLGILCSYRARNCSPPDRGEQLQAVLEARLCASL